MTKFSFRSQCDDVLLFFKAKQRHLNVESDLRNDIKTAENHSKELEFELEKKQQDIEQLLRDQQKSNSEHQTKIRQLENELDEQRRETVRSTNILFLSRSTLFDFL